MVDHAAALRRGAPNRRFPSWPAGGHTDCVILMRVACVSVDHITIYGFSHIYRGLCDSNWSRSDAGVLSPWARNDKLSSQALQRKREELLENEALRRLEVSVDHNYHIWVDHQAALCRLKVGSIQDDSVSSILPYKSCVDHITLSVMC